VAGVASGDEPNHRPNRLLKLHSDRARSTRFAAGHQTTTVRLAPSRRRWRRWSTAGKRNPRYSGALNQPIVRWGLQFVTAEPNDQRLIREFLEKIPLLLDYYEIRPDDPDRWRTPSFWLSITYRECE